MRLRNLQRLDQQTRDVLEAARQEAADLGDEAVGTEHVLLALAGTDRVTASVLAQASASAATLRALATRPHADRHTDNETLLAALGIDLAEIRRRAEQTFGNDAIVAAAARGRRPRTRRPLRTWISCSTSLPSRGRDSPLAGRCLHLIPRVERLLYRASREARPQPASPGHLLLALVAGNEPACEILTELGVDLQALAGALRRAIDESGTARDAPS